MGQVSLVWPIVSIVYWILLFEPFGSICCIGTTPTFFWRMVCPLAMRTWCKRFRCRRFHILDKRTISLLLFFSYPFAAIADYVAWLFTIMAYDFCLLSVCWFSFGGTTIIVGIVSSPSFSKPRSSNSLSRCATIWSYVPFSR